MKPATTTDPHPGQWNESSPAEALANRLLWRVSWAMLVGLGMVLRLFRDLSVTLAILGAAGSIWLLLTGFIHYFCRDPAPNVPTTQEMSAIPAKKAQAEQPARATPEFAESLR